MRYELQSAFAPWNGHGETAAYVDRGLCRDEVRIRQVAVRIILTM
jgi:hypothetical protein